MLLRWSLDESEAADAIESAVRKTLAAGYRTADIASSPDDNILNTEAMTLKVLENI